MEAAGLQFSPIEIGQATSQVDLALLLTRTADGLSAAIEYSPSLFDETRIVRFRDSLLTLLQASLTTVHPRVHFANPAGA